MDSRSAFFFPHARRARGSRPPASPGRAPFDVTARVTDGATVWTDTAVAFADGYAPNTLGPNQDPCVFAPPQPFHSFCRINRRSVNTYVRGEKQLLSEAVRPGDLILYGKFEPKGGHGPTAEIWLDAVMTVDRVVPWPTVRRIHGQQCVNPGCKGKGRPFLLEDPSTFAAQITSKSPGDLTDAYRFNLGDAESRGSHCCTMLGVYGVIVGVADQNPTALGALRTSFVPLPADARDGPVSIDRAGAGADWDELARFIDGHVRTINAGPRGGWIARFPDAALAEALCRAIIRASTLKGRAGVVGLLPLTPITPPLQVGVG